MKTNKTDNKINSQNILKEKTNEDFNKKTPTKTDLKQKGGAQESKADQSAKGKEDEVESFPNNRRDIETSVEKSPNVVDSEEHGIE